MNKYTCVTVQSSPLVIDANGYDVSKQGLMDHIVPIATGGIHDIINIQGLCRSCNAKKHTKVIDYRPNSLRELCQKLSSPDYAAI